MKYLAMIFSIIMLSSCSADWHIKRAIKKDPKITRQARVITHYDTITVITEGDKRDTIFKYRNVPSDTFVLETTKFRTRVIHDTIFKELQVETECFPDTITKIIEVPVESYNFEVKDLKWYEQLNLNIMKGIWLLLILIIIIFLIRRLLQKLL